MDLHGVDLNLLVAFDALMEERSVTRAGARIGRTQPAMSAALSRLRALFGDELFVRAPSGLQPTPRALDLAAPLGHALAEIGRTLSFTQEFEPARSTAILNIGLSEHPAHVLLPALAERIRAAAPSVELRVRSFIARDDAVTMLDAGEVDVTVGVPPSLPAGRILSSPAFEERFLCLMRKGHPAAGAPFDLDSFLAQSHLLVSPENERFGRVDAALEQLGLTRHLAVTLPQMYAAPRLVARSDLVATLMERVITTSGLVGKLEVREPPIAIEPVSFVMAWHRRNDVHPVQRWLREAILDAARDMECHAR